MAKRTFAFRDASLTSHCFNCRPARSFARAPVTLPLHLTYAPTFILASDAERQLRTAARTADLENPATIERAELGGSIGTWIRDSPPSRFPRHSDAFPFARGIHSEKHDGTRRGRHRDDRDATCYAADVR